MSDQCTHGFWGYCPVCEKDEAIVVLTAEVARLRAENKELQARLIDKSAIVREVDPNEAARLRKALAFAACCIKSGEPWTETCEREIGALLK